MRLSHAMMISAAFGLGLYLSYVSSKFILARRNPK